MKFAPLFFAALFAGFFSASNVQASTISGTSGEYTVAPFDDSVSDALSGNLDSQKKITITYTYGGLNPTLLQELVSGSIAGLGKEYASLTGTRSGGTWNFSTLNTSGAPLPVLFLASFGDNTGTVTIKNLSGATTYIKSLFSADVNTADATLGVKYAISAVPLPAAALLFGSGLAALGGVATRRKNQHKA